MNLKSLSDKSKPGKQRIPIRLCLISQWRYDDLDRIPGKPISEAEVLSKEFDLVIFVSYNEQGKFLFKRVSSSLYVYTVPIHMTKSLIRTLLYFVKDLLTMGIFVAKIARRCKIDLIRAENAILGGIPALTVNLIEGTSYGIWLAGSEEDVIGMRYGPGGLASIVIRFLRGIKRVIFRKAKFILAVSSELADYNANLAQSNIILTPNFVDFSRFLCSSRKEPHTPIRFLFAGRLEVEKGIKELLEAVKMLENDADFILLVAGWGSLLPLVIKNAEEHSCIRYIGRFPHVEMPSVYSKADVLVLPSHTEGMPAVILEAMASGLPVIASSVGQIPEILETGVHGKLIPPGDVSKLAEAISRFIDHPSDIESMRLAVRQRAIDVSGKYLAFHSHLYRTLFDI